VTDSPDTPAHASSLRLARGAAAVGLPVRIRSVRKNLGLTQAQMADAVGASLRAYIRYETGTIEMPLHVWWSFEDLGVSSAYLRFGVRPMTHHEPIA
jgi:DNA-binding XRE family transcriptional regulator